MNRVLLVHAGNIPHYRVSIYSYLSTFLKKYGFELIVVSDEIQTDNLDNLEFQYKRVHLST